MILRQPFITHQFKVNIDRYFFIFHQLSSYINSLVNPTTHCCFPIKRALLILYNNDIYVIVWLIRLFFNDKMLYKRYRPILPFLISR